MIITWLSVPDMRLAPRTAIALAASTALLATACSADTSGTSTETSITVAASFYPLQFVAESVAGDLGDVTSLTAPGVEPHDLELSPSTVRGLGEADVVLYIAQFQPAVDEAIETTGAHSLDASAVISLHAAEEHADDAHEDEGGEEDEHGSSDPHFWLEPGLLAEYAVAVGAEFATLDPEHADEYTANAASLAASLRDLDTDFREGLSSCKRTDIVVTHEAFGYLAEAYGLHQEGLAGLEPDSEPSPARLLEIKDIIAESGATTIFSEALVSPKVAEALAADAGVVTKVLDPIESVADGDDYIKVMTRNLEELRTALECA